jgi:MFS family permease
LQTIELALARHTDEKRLTLAWWAVVSRFLLHGLIVGTWVSRIPAIRDNLGLNNAALGFCLLGTAIGSLVAVPSTGWLISKFGSKTVTTWSTMGFCLALVIPSFAFSAASLFAALILYGAMAGANDVCINSQAVAVEQVLERPTMSRFHAMFSIGGMLASGLGGFAAQYEIAPRLHFGIAAAAFLLLSISTGPLLLEANDHAARQRARFRIARIPPVLIALVAIGFAMFLSEGAIADWSGVYLKQNLNASAGLAAAAYAAFSAGMAIFRLLGDVVTKQMGPVNTLRLGAFTAAFGLAVALASHSPLTALPGFALSGAGFSVIVPLAFGASGRITQIPRAAAIALVSGSGYIGFLFGPPLIGLLAQRSTLRLALCLLIALSIFAGALATAVRRPEVTTPEPVS